MFAQVMLKRYLSQHVISDLFLYLLRQSTIQLSQYWTLFSYIKITCNTTCLYKNTEFLMKCQCLSENHFLWLINHIYTVFLTTWSSDCAWIGVRMLLPPGIRNDGNICFSSSILQCQQLCRKVLADVGASHISDCKHGFYQQSVLYKSFV